MAPPDTRHLKPDTCRRFTARLLVFAAVSLTCGLAAAQPREAIFAFAGEYGAFLDGARTPYEVSEAAVAMAKGRGFAVVDPTAPGGIGPVKAGRRLLFVNRGLTTMAVVVGRRPVEEGMRLVVAHSDAPSLRLHARPVSGDRVVHLLAEPYGGLKRYHYEGLPLAIRGVVVRPGGERVDVRLGPEQGFVFMAQDLSTRARIQEEAPRGSTFELIAASRPAAGDAREPVRLTLLAALHHHYGLTEADLDAAHLYAVPVWGSRDVGLDRMVLGGFGHDDRVCSFAALRALIDGEAVPEQTAVVVLVDREEIGSTGVTGMRSEYFRTAVGALLEAQGRYDENRLRRALHASRALSSDVTAAINPIFSEVQEASNAPRAGGGPAMMKATGHGGKMGGSDASAELVRAVQDLFDRAGLPLQTSEIGQVDEGGGGTIAKYLASQGVDVLDLGVALLSMHSPFELVHKRDLFQLYQGFSAFLWSDP